MSKKLIHLMFIFCFLMCCQLHGDSAFEVLTVVVINSSIFWDITPCSLLKFSQCFLGICRLHLQGRISRARNQHKSKMEVTCSTETSVDLQRTTRCYIQEARTLHIISSFVPVSLPQSGAFKVCNLYHLKQQMSDVTKQTCACTVVFSDIIISTRSVEAQRKGNRCDVKGMLQHGALAIKWCTFLRA
jgi:hypothetical protein